jgi:AhpD family alkylhydroperoxidase
MEARIDYFRASPDAGRAMRSLEDYVDGCGLEVSLLDLVKLRASILNRCAYCIDMHTKDALSRNETEQRLHALVAWQETPFYTDRERAALAWTDAVTHVGHGVSDEVFQAARRHFSERELVDLTLGVIAINGWNRLAIPFRTPPGSYRPRAGALRDGELT